MNFACTLLETNKRMKAYAAGRYFEVRNDTHTVVRDTSIYPVFMFTPNSWNPWDPSFIGLTSIYDIHGNYWKYYA